MPATKVNFLRLPDVLRRAAVSKATFYDRRAKRLFPQAILVGRRAAAYIEHEVDEVLAAQARGATDDELRDLVRELEAARGATA